VKSFDQIRWAVVTEPQRAPGAKARLVLEIEALAEAGCDDADVGVASDNARQPRFRAESTGLNSDAN
jgi:hypothetical protein